jgi:hypothetical protein
MLKRRKNEAKKVIGQRFNTFSREYQSMQPELVEGPLGKRAAFANVFLPRLTCFYYGDSAFNSPGPGFGAGLPGLRTRFALR